MGILKNVKNDLKLSAICLGTDKPVNGSMFNVFLATQASKSAQILVKVFYQLKSFCKDSNVEPDIKMWVKSFAEGFEFEMKRRGERK